MNNKIENSIASDENNNSNTKVEIITSLIYYQTNIYYDKNIER